MTTDTTNKTITDRVRERYANAAKAVQTGSGCCDTGCCTSLEEDAVTRDLYDAGQTDLLPEEAALASLGCGNPTALIDLHEGQTVLDLGSGGGIDVLLSARRVGPTGFVYGVDMTDEMLALAQQNKEKAGVTNVAFLKGRIEEIPLPANTVDVVISNCVINLAADKSLVLNDAFRVLKPGCGIRIVVPSLGNAIRAFQQENRDWFISYPQEFESLGGKLSNYLFCAGQHRAAFDFSHLDEILRKTGFHEVIESSDGNSIIHPDAPIYEPESPGRSLFVEARKR